MVIPMPLWLLAAIYVGWDAITFLGRVHSPVAVVVHLGGALFAFVYFKQNWRLMNWWADVRDWSSRLTKPKLRIYRQPTLTSTPVSGRSKPDEVEHLEADLDRVLAKVAEHGQNSLTDAERKILLQASEVYKRRRT
jgi:hypothetical protein